MTEPLRRDGRRHDRKYYLPGGKEVETKEEAMALIGLRCAHLLRKFRLPPHVVSASLGFDLFKYCNEKGTSSHGEYGILREIFRRLAISKGVLCEFGAWDGIRYSNTYNLITQHGWTGVLMEADAERYVRLAWNAEDWPGIRTYDTLIHYDPTQGTLLDDFFDTVQMPKDFDLLSIDIDSFDYQVWDSLQRYNPKVVVIEADDLDLEIIQDPAIKHANLGGSTCFPPMKRLGESKGYTLVAYTGNLIFVRNDLVDVVKDWRKEQS